MKEIKVTAADIARAFNKKKHSLLAVESGCGCSSAAKKLVVANQAVVLRQMLEYFGFSTEEIDRHLHDS